MCTVLKVYNRTTMCANDYFWEQHTHGQFDGLQRVSDLGDILDFNGRQMIGCHLAEMTQLNTCITGHIKPHSGHGKLMGFCHITSMFVKIWSKCMLYFFFFFFCVPGPCSHCQSSPEGEEVCRLPQCCYWLVPPSFSWSPASSGQV